MWWTAFFFREYVRLGETYFSTLRDPDFGFLFSIGTGVEGWDKTNNTKNKGGTPSVTMTE